MQLSYWTSPSKKSSIPPFKRASVPMTCKSGSQVEQRAYLCIEKCKPSVPDMNEHVHTLSFTGIVLIHALLGVLYCVNRVRPKYGRKVFQFYYNYAMFLHCTLTSNPPGTRAHYMSIFDNAGLQVPSPSS